MKKTIILLLGILVSTAGSRAETFTVDPAHSDIGFAVKHLMISNVRGGFNRFEGTVEYDLSSGVLVSIEGWIDTGSIDTNNGKRDDHLKAGDFFNVSAFPRMTFKSIAVEKSGADGYRVKGLLNVLGVAREVVLPVTVAGPIDDPWGNRRIGLSCRTTLNRRELGITNSPSSMISDEVELDINAEVLFKPAP